MPLCFDRRTPTDPQRAAFSVSTRLADTYPYSCCRQGRLLLLRVDRCLQSSPEQTTCSLSWTLPLVWSSTSEDQSTSLRCFTIFTGCGFLSGSDCVLTLRCLHGSAPSYLVNSLCRTVNVAGRQRPAFIRRTLHAQRRRSTFGDRIFPVTAARVWNRLPASVSVHNFRYSAVVCFHHHRH